MKTRIILNFFFLFISSVLISQGLTYHIVGTVFNTDKKTVAGWPVAITGDPASPGIKLITDRNGNYEHSFRFDKGSNTVYQIVVEDPCNSNPLIQKAIPKDGEERFDFIICSKNTPGGSPCDGKFTFTIGKDGWFEFHAAPEFRDGTYYWDFGDGTTAEGKDVRHQYAKEGVYVVTLVIATTTCKSQFVAKVEVKTTVRPPAPTDVFDNSCCGKVHISGIRTSTAATPNTFLFNAGSDFRAKEVSWDFGDGETGTGVDIKHSYAKPGKYLITTTISGEFCKVILNTWIHVQDVVTPPPSPCNIDFVFSVGNLSAKFSPDFKGAVADKVRWDFGDGSYSTDEITSHTYAKAGEYKVTLYASINGQTCQITKVIKVGSRVNPPNPVSIVIYDVSPNPGLEDIMVSIKSSIKASATLVISDLSNVYHVKQPVDLEIGDNKVPMIIKDLKPGSYFIYLYYDNNIVSKAKFQKI